MVVGPRQKRRRGALRFRLLLRQPDDVVDGQCAADRGVAVIINRPFREGELIRSLARHPLPGWAAEIDCVNWAQVLLKFIVSHPAVTCAIPATSRVGHVRENMGAAYGRIPDAAMRARMAADVGKL